ncbi:Fic family protein [Oscillospiraceae bacterium OttesenSCG-928-F05]|nr:Fic family protein [Oscillospiraceae bacterium OttesenSCG-928-F05]
MDFSQIDTLLLELNRARPLNPGELARLSEQFTIEFTYESNAIEGNTMTLSETALVLKEGVTIAGKPLREHLELIGHRDAFDYVRGLVGPDAPPLSESVIKTIHSLVLMNDRDNRGVYRSVQVVITGAAHTPPPPFGIAPQMEELIADYHSGMATLHPIERAALFHIRFEGVYPFIDGNGRTGRLVMNLELMRGGYPLINIKHADRRRYYQCFTDYHQGGGDPAAMTGLIGEYVEAELESRLELIRARDSATPDEPDAKNKKRDDREEIR